jgi:hypothetical protein
MLLDQPIPRTPAETSSADRLRTTMAAMRLSFTWFGTRKTLSTEQKAQAAESFGAEGEFLSAGKKLIDTRDPAFRAVTAVRSQATAYFKGVSLPYPEPGIRLIRQPDIEQIDRRMQEFRQELESAVDRLDSRFDQLKAAARSRLGDLYNEADYPATLSGLFEVAWEFPSVEPPEYLQRLKPELYEQECQRVQAKFDEAIRLAEAAFTDELAKLVDHLAERLSGQDDGTPKVFRDSIITNLTEFFARFQKLNVRSNEQLDELVERASEIVQGVEPQQLRDNRTLRQQVSSQLSVVQSQLDEMLVDRPRRNILRKPR